jgi:hypothetical protein
LCIALAMVATNCSAQNNSVKSGAPPPPPRSAPAPNAEVAALLERLQTLAASTAAADQTELAKQLGERRTLDLLDDPATRDRSRTQDLRLARVIDKLRDNSAASAAQTLVALAGSAEFASSAQRSELLVRASAARRPLPPPLLAFLDAQARPDSVNLRLAIDALCENDTAAAWEVVGRKLADDSIEPEYKTSWLRGPILEHRRSTTMLELAEKLLKNASLDRGLRVGLAEALFDYRPNDWYPGRDGVPRPPEESRTSPQAAAQLRRVGGLVAGPEYPKAVRDAARRTLSGLD